MLKLTRIVAFIYALKTDLDEHETNTYLQVWREIFVDEAALKSMVDNSLAVTLVGKDLLTISSLINAAHGRKFDFSCDLFKRNASILVSISLKDSLSVEKESFRGRVPGWPKVMEKVAQSHRSFLNAAEKALGFKVYLDKDVTSRMDVDITLVGKRHAGSDVPEELGRRLVDYPNNTNGSLKTAFINLHRNVNEVKVLKVYREGDSNPEIPQIMYNSDAGEIITFENFKGWRNEIWIWLPY
jgi:hypothetical protein